MKYACASILFAMLTGCATIGKEIDTSLIDQMQVGVSTKEDAIRVLGKPTILTSSSSGISILGWNYARAILFSGTKASGITLTFGPDGKLTNKSATQINQAMR